MKKKLTEEQSELLALLPQGLPKMTDGAKLVLANIILWYGTEASKESGMMYRTNLHMMKDTGIKSENTIITSVKQLESLGVISTKRGKRGEASEYRLTDEFITAIKQNDYCNKQKFITAIKNDFIEVKSDKQLNNNDLITAINTVIMTNKEIYTAIEGLTLAINELKGEFTVLRNEITALKKSYCSTDTDTESETEKDTIVQENETEVKVTCTDDVCAKGTEVDETVSNETEEDGSADADVTSMGTSVNDTSIEVKTTPKVKLSKEEVDRRNKYISEVYRKIDGKLNYMATVHTYFIYAEVVRQTAELFKDAQAHEEWFTERQWGMLSGYHNRFVRLTEVKDEQFCGDTAKNADADTISMDEQLNADSAKVSSTVDKVGDGGAEPKKCRDFTKDEVIAWVSENVNKYYSYQEWENAIIAKLNRKYTGWDAGKDINASRFYNMASKWADNHYRSLDDSIGKTPTPTEENETIEPAPWETVEETAEPAKFSDAEVEEWKTTIKDEIRDGVYQWSLTLTEIPDSITDDADKIVRDVLEKHPEWQDYKGLFQLSDFTKHTKYLLENRLTNKDIPAIVSQNQYQERHKKFLKELVN